MIKSFAFTDLDFEHEGKTLYMMCDQYGRIQIADNLLERFSPTLWTHWRLDWFGKQFLILKHDRNWRATEVIQYSLLNIFVWLWFKTAYSLRNTFWVFMGCLVRKGILVVPQVEQLQWRYWRRYLWFSHEAKNEVLHREYLRQRNERYDRMTLDLVKKFGNVKITDQDIENYFKKRAISTSIEGGQLLSCSPSLKEGEE